MSVRSHNPGLLLLVDFYVKQWSSVIAQRDFSVQENPSAVPSKLQNRYLRNLPRVIPRRVRVRCNHTTCLSTHLGAGCLEDRDCLAALTAGTKKEIAYLTKFGKPMQSIQRLRREIYDYRSQPPIEHLASLEIYLQIAPYLIPKSEPTLTRPIIRHPDLQPDNIFVSDNLDLTGLIDWQHCTVLPLFLQCGIPGSFQNYGDDVS